MIDPKKQRRLLFIALATAILALMIATIALADSPVPAESGYCVGIPVESCPYNWSYDQGRWWTFGPHAMGREDLDHDRAETPPGGQ